MEYRFVMDDLQVSIRWYARHLTAAIQRLAGRLRADGRFPYPAPI
jgi:hypothetical protein